MRNRKGRTFNPSTHASEITSHIFLFYHKKAKSQAIFRSAFKFLRFITLFTHYSPFLSSFSSQPASLPFLPPVSSQPATRLSRQRRDLRHRIRRRHSHRAADHRPDSTAGGHTRPKRHGRSCGGHNDCRRTSDPGQSVLRDCWNSLKTGIYYDVDSWWK